MIDKLKKNKWIFQLIMDTSWKEKKRLFKTWPKSKQYYEVPESHTNMKELLKCTLCPNMCRFECPTLRLTRKEMYAPATKARISYHMERGDITPTDLHTAEVPYICTNCNGCQAWCPMDISVGELLKGVRADLVAKEIYIPHVKEFNDRVCEERTAFTKNTFTSNDKFNVINEGAEYFYYPGCVMAEKKPETVIKNIELLKKANIPFSTYANERQCCGGPLNTLGFVDGLKSFARQNLGLFEKSGAKTIITDCPACAYTMIQSYKEAGFNHNFNVITTVDFYLQLLKDGKLKIKNEVPVCVTYHDPCYTARGLDKRETLLNDPVNINKKQYTNSAREILSLIQKVELREPVLHGKETQCCGRGGVMHIHHPELSDEMGKERVSQLKETGADIILSSCPSCEEGFITNNGGDVRDITDILYDAIF